MKEVFSRSYVRITGLAAGRPADRLSRRQFADDPPTIPKHSPPFLIRKVIIGRVSNEEWTSEGAYVGHVDENGCFSMFFLKK